MGPHRRLRAAASAFLAALAMGFLAQPARARGAPLRILLAVSVAPAARSVISEDVWEGIVARHLDGQVVRASKSAPTLDDCHRASADYIVVAPFSLRPRLPGMANASGRTAGQTHLVVTNCLTDDVMADRIVSLESDPPSPLSAGDIDAEPGIVWNKAVDATLSRIALVFPRYAHVVRVTPPFAMVDAGGFAVAEGQQLRLFASASKQKKGPLVLTVLQVNGKLAQVIYRATPGGAVPASGDLVEVLPTAAPRPSP